VVALARGNDGEAVSEPSRQYLNRLSDLLFVLARWLNKHAGHGDVMWQKGINA
jgi:cob(I)alamin adenosyltransferase